MKSKFDVYYKTKFNRQKRKKGPYVVSPTKTRYKLVIRKYKNNNCNSILLMVSENYSKWLKVSSGKTLEELYLEYKIINVIDYVIPYTDQKNGYTIDIEFESEQDYLVFALSYL